jgi:capsular exopolysaccharide synthesis family protein
MSKTYEALKRAETLRSKQAMAEGVPNPPLPVNGTDDYYELRRRLFGSAVGDTIKTVLVVSSLHGEGASGVCCLLAKAMSDRGRSKVLLVDLNLRTPSLWRQMNVGGHEGFVNMVAEGKSVADVVQTTESGGVRVITAGSGRLNAIDVIDSERTIDLVGGMSQHADIVFIDAPPVTLYPDSRALAPLVDGVVLVVEADVTPVSVANRAAQMIRETGANLIGVVLNKRRDYIPDRIARLVG